MKRAVGLVCTIILKKTNKRKLLVRSTQGVFDLFNCPFYSILKFNALIRKTMGTITNSNA